jgi:hypothetical protein
MGTFCCFWKLLLGVSFVAREMLGNIKFSIGPRFGYNSSEHFPRKTIARRRRSSANLYAAIAAMSLR